jgi:chaperonin cofactor prefoldin
MVVMREAWTDERLDDFKERVDQRFDEVDRRFDRLEVRFDDLNRRFDHLQVTLVAGLLGLTALQLT